MAAHDQPARLAVDLAHHRVGHDHAVEAAIHPCLQHWISFPVVAANVGLPKYIVNLDYIDQYICHDERMAEFPGSGAPARRVGGDALRLCEPRPAALGGGRRPPRAALPRRRHRAAEAPPRRRPQGRVDRQPRARFRHAGSRIGADPDRGRPSLLSRPRCHGAGAHRLAGGDRPPPVELRRQAVRRRQPPAHDHGAAPGLAGRGHARRRSIAASCCCRRRPPSTIRAGSRTARRCSRPASACCAC